MNYLRRMAIGVFYSALGLAIADAGEPLDLIRSTHERYIETLNDPILQSKEKRRELHDRLNEILMPVLDVDETAKRALAKHWNDINAAQRKEFLEVFRSYVETLENIPTRHSSKTLVLERETVYEYFAEVQGHYYFPQGRNAPVVYKLHLVDGKWKIYDSTGWGVDRIANLRAQFNRVIDSSSFEGLLKVLRERKAAIEKRRAAGK